MKTESAAGKKAKRFFVWKTIVAVFAIAFLIAVFANRDESREGDNETRSQTENEREIVYPSDDGRLGETPQEQFAAKIAGMFLRELKKGNVEYILDAVGDNRWVLEQAMQQSGISANSPALKKRMSRVPDLVLSSSEHVDSSPPSALGIRAAYIVGATNPKTGERVPIRVNETLDGSLVVLPSRELVNFLSGVANSPF